MNNRINALLALAAIAVSEPRTEKGRAYNPEPVDQASLDKQNTERLIKRGAKVFEIEGRMYLALNEKNAIKKHDRYKANSSF